MTRRKDDAPDVALVQDSVAAVKPETDAGVVDGGSVGHDNAAENARIGGCRGGILARDRSRGLDRGGIGRRCGLQRLVPVRHLGCGDHKCVPRAVGSARRQASSLGDGVEFRRSTVPSRRQVGSSCCLSSSRFGGWPLRDGCLLRRAIHGESEQPGDQDAGRGNRR